MSDTAFSQKSTSVNTSQKVRLNIFAGRSGQKRKEALLAYTFLFPAMLIIGVFGLFPLIFSAYQSTRAGLNNVVGRPDGLGQYIRAIDNLAYVLAFWLAIAFIIFGIQRFREGVATAQKYEEAPWLILLPGLIAATGLGLMLIFIFNFLPGLLAIGEEMNKLNLPAELRTQLFPTFLGAIWRAPAVSNPFWGAIATFVIAFGMLYALNRQGSLDQQRSSTYFTSFTSGFFLIILAIALTIFTWTEIQAAYAEALEAGTALNIWAQLVTISAGFVLLLLSWIMWRSAAFRATNISTGLRLLAGILLLIGGWVLIGELPAAIAEGKEDWWIGLLNTVFYAIGSLPLQLALGLLGATLLFQDIKGKSLLRVIYFLPFITPAVGSAAVFRVLFTGNSNGTINIALARMGLDTAKWLNEPTGIFELMSGSLGLSLPDWAAGPSLALVVVMIYSIWRYVGYNIVFFLAGLGNISGELYEAASIDGAGRWEQFRNITIPLLSPITYFLTIFGVIGTFKAFNTIFVLRTQAALGTMDTASLVIFDAFNRDTRYGYAAALGIILLVIILSATAFFDRLSKDKVFYG